MIELTALNIMTLTTQSLQISEVLKHVSNLPTRDEFTIVNAGNEDIKKDLGTTTTKLQALEPHLLVTENRLDVSEEKIGNLEDIIGEEEDRFIRARNLMIYNVPESSSVDIKSRMAHDLALVKKLIQVIAHDVDNYTIKVLTIRKS